MKKMFTDEAEFSDLIENSENLTISEVKHKAVIDVNEEGTEAGAGTYGNIELMYSINIISPNASSHNFQ